MKGSQNRDERLEREKHKDENRRGEREREGERIAEEKERDRNTEHRYSTAVLLSRLCTQVDP